MVSVCCFAAEQLLITDRRSFISYPLMAVLAVYFAAILPLATKTEPLRPMVALFVVSIVYRWRPRFGPVLGGLALLIIVMEFFYPAVTLTRMTAFAEQRPVPIVFGEVAIKSIADPSELAYVREYSDRFEQGIGQNYYGRVMGFWDRFTPQVTDQLISGSQYLQPRGLDVFAETLYQVLPQSLGFKKNLNAQIRTEVALNRSAQGGGKVSWANSGFVGDGFVTGGIFMAAAFCLVFGFGTSVASQLVFVYKTKDILWIPFSSAAMFIVADGGFIAGAYSYFWSWMIYVAVLFVLLRYMARRPSARPIA